MDDLYDRLSILADEASSSAPTGDRQDVRPYPVVGGQRMDHTSAERARDDTATSVARLKLMD